MIRTAAFCILLLLSGCAQSAVQQRQPQIAYADLEVLYAFVLEHDADYVSFRTVLLEKRKSGTPLTETEEAIKKEVLLQVDSAVRFVAREKKIDLVLNKGDSLLYGSTGTDITQLVLNELKVRIYRNKPASR